MVQISFIITIILNTSIGIKSKQDGFSYTMLTRNHFKLIDEPAIIKMYSKDNHSFIYKLLETDMLP